MVHICNKCGECYIETVNGSYHECMNSVIESQRELDIQQKVRVAKINLLTEKLNKLNINLLKNSKDKELIESIKETIKLINEA